MGLDLILEARENPHTDWFEVCYGRKTWNIANFFRNRNAAIKGDYLYGVSKQSWIEFCEYIEKYDIPRIRNILKSNIDEDYLSDEDYDYIEDFTDMTDVPCQLGLIWEATAILNWYDKKEEVLSLFDKGYEFHLIVSF